MTTTVFLQLVTNGIAQGAMYGLIAVGYTMVYGIIQLINFAHGEFFMFGGFGALAVYLWIPPVQHLPLLAALPIMLIGGMIASVIIAILAERFAYRPLRNAPRLAPLITAIGVSILLQQLVFLWYPQPGGHKVTIGVTAPVQFPTFTGKPFHLGGVLLQRADLLTVIVSVICMAYLAYFVMKTRTGRAMQATAQDPDTARLMGINTDRVIVVAFVLGAAFAAVAAITYGLRYGQVVLRHGLRRRTQSVHRGRARRHRQHLRRDARRSGPRHRGAGDHRYPGAATTRPSSGAPPGRTCGRSCC